jgi:hypothetical protein
MAFTTARGNGAETASTLSTLSFSNSSGPGRVNSRWPDLGTVGAVTMGTGYTGFLHTGSGSDTITMTVDGDAVHITIRSRWMAQDWPHRCELWLNHHRLAGHHGVLRVTTAATAPDDESATTPLPELTDEDAILPLTLEYLLVGPTERYVPPSSMLAAMGPAGYATWNDTFELLLLVSDEGWPEDPVWEHIRFRLDKARLARDDG